MGCKSLNVVSAYPDQTSKINKWGFADVDGSLSTGFANRMFETPCEEHSVVGNREAIGIGFTFAGGPPGQRIKVQFTVNYLRPGESVKTSWVAVFELYAGTYDKYIYHKDLKYVKGQYTGLTIQTVILK